jgi:hypothetical protein
MTCPRHLRPASWISQLQFLTEGVHASTITGRIVRHEVSNFVLLCRSLRRLRLYLLGDSLRAKIADVGLLPNQRTSHCSAFSTTLTRGLKVEKNSVLAACVSGVPRTCCLLVSRGQVSSVPVPKQLRLPEERMRFQIERPQQDSNTIYRVYAQCFAQIDADHDVTTAQVCRKPS